VRGLAGMQVEAVRAWYLDAAAGALG